MIAHLAYHSFLLLLDAAAVAAATASAAKNFAISHNFCLIQTRHGTYLLACSTTATGFAVSSDFLFNFFSFHSATITKIIEYTKTYTAEIKACRGITRLVCFLFVQKKKPKSYAVSRASRLACHSGTSKLKFYKADQWPSGRGMHTCGMYLVIVHTV